jgi:hypothetical protein
MKIITTKANQVIGIFTFITLVFCSYGNSAERKAYQFVIVKSAVDKAYLSCAKETEPSATLHTYKNPMYWTVYTPEFEEALVQLVASFDTMRNIKIEDCKKSLEDIRTQVIKLIGIKNENIEKKAEDAKVVLDKKNIKSAIDEKNKNYKSSDISLLQRINPNNFPLCPKPDISKKRDFGPGSWTEKWDNCWASISMVQIEYNGEFQRGIPNGLGEMILIQNEKKIRYAGDFKDGRPHGLVTILGDDKIKYEGQMKNGQINGMGALYTEDFTRHG